MGGFCEGKAGRLCGRPWNPQCGVLDIAVSGGDWAKSCQYQLYFRVLVPLATGSLATCTGHLSFSLPSLSLSLPPPLAPDKHFLSEHPEANCQYQLSVICSPGNRLPGNAHCSRIVAVQRHFFLSFHKQSVLFKLRTYCKGALLWLPFPVKWDIWGRGSPGESSPQVWLCPLP